MKNFGSTFQETREAFLGARGGSKTKNKSKAIGRIVVSLSLIAVAAFFVWIDRGSSQDIAKFLFGAVIGYWIK